MDETLELAKILEKQWKSLEQEESSEKRAKTVDKSLSFREAFEKGKRLARQKRLKKGRLREQPRKT